MSEKSRKMLKWGLIALAALVVLAAVAGMIYWNRMLNLLGDADETVPTLSYEEEMALLGVTEETQPTETTAQTCNVCGYVIKPTLAHTHSYAESWTTDENGHWHPCSGCEVKGSYATHNFENPCDSACDVCGYSRDVSHNYENTWSGNAESHYHVCVGCGEKSDVAAHIPGAEATAETAQTCTVCGFEIAPALEEPTTEPTPDNAGTTDGAVPDKSDDSADSDFPWWIFAVISAVEAIIIVFLVLKKKG